MTLVSERAAVGTLKHECVVPHWQLEGADRGNLPSNGANEPHVRRLNGEIIFCFHKTVLRAIAGVACDAAAATSRDSLRVGLEWIIAWSNEIHGIPIPPSP